MIDVGTGQLDANRKRQAPDAIKEYRESGTKPKIPRAMDSLKCKVFRTRKTTDDLSILPGPDTETLEVFQDSFK
jgi:hypothetical protein